MAFISAKSRLCSKENSRERIPLKLSNLGCPAYDLYEKSKIFYSLKGKSSVPGSTRLCQSTALQVLSCILIDQDEVKVNKYSKMTEVDI